MRLLFFIAFTMLFFLGAPLGYADEAVPVTEEGAFTAYQEAVKALGLQTEMPEAEIPKEAPQEITPIRFPAWLFDFARYLLYGSLALVAFLIIFKLVDAWRHGPDSRKLEAEAEATDEAPEAVAARMDRAHLEAEDLAARGLFGEAMHLLLLRSLGEMRLRLGISIAVSLTSREIVGRVKLGELTRTALADLVRRVELAYFGEYEAGESEYLASRRSFETLSNNLRQGGAA